jgi:uncharacterized protein YjbI with pentapeptide repeats
MNKPNVISKLLCLACTLAIILSISSCSEGGQAGTGGDFNFQLDVEGQARIGDKTIANADITIEYNGQTYTAVTDSTGRYQVTLTDPVINDNAITQITLTTNSDANVNQIRTTLVSLRPPLSQNRAQFIYDVTAQTTAEYGQLVDQDKQPPATNDQLVSRRIDLNEQQALETTAAIEITFNAPQYAPASAQSLIDISLDPTIKDQIIIQASNANPQLVTRTFNTLLAQSDPVDCSNLVDNANLKGCDLKSVSLSNQSITNAAIDYADLSGIEISLSTLTASSLRFANLSSTIISSQTQLNAIDATGASFNLAVIQTSNLADLEGLNSQWLGVQIRDSAFNRALLNGANFSGATISNTDFSGADLTNANFQDATLTDILNWDSATFNNTRCSDGSVRNSPCLISSVDTPTPPTEEPSPEPTTCNLDDLTSDLRNCDFSTGDLAGIDLSGLDLSGSNLSSANLSGTNLTGATLNSTNFTAANLTSANFINTNLTNAVLLNAEITSTQWDGATWQNTTCPDGTVANQSCFAAPETPADEACGEWLDNTDFTGCNFSSQSFIDASARNAIFDGANLGQTTVSNSDLSGASMQGAVATNAIWQNIELAQSSLQALDATTINLTLSNLQGSNAQNSGWNNAVLEQLNLTNSNFNGASFEGALLNQIDFSGSDLSNASFLGANLSNITWGNATLNNTRCPDGQITNTSCEAPATDPDPQTPTLGADCDNLTPAPGADFRNCNLRERDFANMDLSGSNFSGADLTQASLFSSNLSNTIFDNAQLFTAALQDSNLSGISAINADFTSTNLRRANLTNVTMTGANLSHATLDGAFEFNGDWSNVTWFATICPNGSVQDSSCF